MAKKVKLMQNGVTIHPATTTDMVVDPALRAPLGKMITEINVSELYPTGGIGGSNKYDLATAIAKIPVAYRTVGIKCSYLNELGIKEEYEYLGEEFLQIKNWKNIATGECIDNNEFQHLVVDADGNIIEAIREGAKETFLPHIFHAGIRTKEIDDVNNQLRKNGAKFEELDKKINTFDTSKENHVEGKSTINKEYADARSTELINEYVEVVLDQNDAVIEGTRRDGTKVIHRLEVEHIEFSPETERNIAIIANTKAISGLGEQRFKDLFASFFDFVVSEPDYSTNIINPYVIHIKSQADFESTSIKTKINEGIAAGNKVIVLSLECDKLYYNENHLLINKANYPNAADVRLLILGEDTMLTSAGDDYDKTNAVSDEGDRYVCNYNNVFNPQAAFLDQNGELVNMFDRVKHSLSEATFEQATQMWKLKICTEDLNSEATHICVTGDYVAPIYKIEKFEAGYVFFKNTSGYDWAPNGDYKYAKLYPRYALINSKNAPVHIANGKIKIQKNISKLHECRCGSFINVVDGSYIGDSFVYEGNTFLSYDIQGIRFKGNAFNYDKRVINFDASRNEHAWIRNCSYSCLFSEGVYARCGCANIKVSDCYFSEMYNGGIAFVESKQYTSRNVTIVRNKFCNTNLRIYNIRAQIGVLAENMLVKNNELIDCTASIGAGIHNTMYQPSMMLGGVIEENTMYFTREFAIEKYKHCYMDCGCMYFMMNNNLHVRNNIIANYTGMAFNNAIYCDDGAKGLKIYSNAIINNSGNGGADIHSRMVEKRPDGSLIAGHNTDNHIGYNLLTTWYHFVGAENCTNGMNIIFNNKNNSKVSVDNKDANYHVGESEIDSNRIRVDPEYAKIFKGLPVSELILSKVLSFNKY